jgi:multidrug efflux pump subunit AcrA (membrane-fusion protein)
MTLIKIIFYLCAVVLIGCHTNTPVPQEAPPTVPGTPVTVTAVDISSLREVAELNATAAFLQKSVVKANTNGYLREGNIRLGQFVRAGQLLYTLQNKEANALGNLVEKVDTSFHLQTLIDIRANQTGFITQLDRQPGDYVQDGEQLAIISDAKSFAFVLDLPFEMRRYLSFNRTVELVLPDSTRMWATVESAMPTVDPVSQTQRFVLKVPTADGGRSIPENLIVRVLWIKSIKTKAISLPKAAVLTDEMQRDWWIMKLTDDSTAVRVPIQKGIESGDRVEIVSPVLSSTARILLSGNFGLPDTARVVIINEKE